MNREILFRGKRVDNGEWIAGSLISFYDGRKGILPSNAKAYVPQGKELLCSADFYDVDPDTVGQYIGLTDKSGTKIFESDIVQWEYKKEKIGVVKYGDFNCSCCSGVYGWYFDGGDIRCVSQYTVIGNAYDNLDLLPQEENFDIQEPKQTESEQTKLAETYMRAMVDAGKEKSE